MSTVYLTREEQQLIVDSIKQAELNTTGEIRVHIEGNCKYDPIDRAASIFNKLGMYKTQFRNGVLIYVAIKDRRFAIIGDKGINQVVPDDFWNMVRDKMRSNFINGNIVKGISEAVILAGEQLKKFFPYNSDDKNELSDQISFGKL